jgi:hypothetical protein
MVDISPTDEMLEPKFGQIVTPQIVAIPVNRWNPDTAIPDFPGDLGEYWGYNSDFFD